MMDESDRPPFSVDNRGIITIHEACTIQLPGVTTVKKEVRSMSKQHMPGPWKVQDEILGADNGGGSLTALGDLRSFNPADAARMVACVNACEGIPHPEAISDMIDALRIAMTSNENLHHLVTNADERITSVVALSAILKALKKAGIRP